MKKVLLSVPLILFFGCVGAPLRAVAPDFEKVDTYNVGQIQEKSVGEAMVYDLAARFLPGFVSVKDYQVPGILGITYPLIKVGYECATVGSLENGDYVCSLQDKPTVFNGERVNWAYCLVIDKNGSPYGDTACNPVHVREWGERPQIFRTSKIYQEGSFKRELIYNGRSKDVLKLQYREFNNSFARPAFYQDLIYDLSESKVIGFKGMQIEILEATNSTIKFIVKSKMN